MRFVLKSAKIQNWKDVIDVRDGSIFTKSYEEFINARYKTQKARDKRLVDETVPKWYKTLVMEIGQEVFQHHNFEITTKTNLKPQICPETIQTVEKLIENLPNWVRDAKHLSAWTDGSLYHEELGCGILLHDDQNHRLRFSFKVPKDPLGPPSSTRAELWAIQTAVYLAVKADILETLTIYTDSQAAIAAIQKHKKWNVSQERQKVKASDINVLDNIHIFLKKFNHFQMNFIKVKANIKENDIADTLAKRGRDLAETEPTVVLGGTAYLKYNGIITGVNPREAIEIMVQKKQIQAFTDDKLRNLEHASTDSSDQLDIPGTLRMIKQAGQIKDHLNITNHKETLTRLKVAFGRTSNKTRIA